MKQLKFLVIAILGIMTFISCSSDDEGTTDPNAFIEVPFNENYLEGENWYYLDILDQNGNSIKDQVLKDCELDNYYVFDDITKDYEFNASNIRCEGEPVDRILDEGTYSINEEQNNVIINLDNGTSVTRMLFVKILRDQNGSGNIKMRYTTTTDNYTYELRKGVFN